MNKLSIIVISAMALALVSCTTTNPTTGQREFDEASTAMLLAPMEAPIAAAVHISSKNDANTRSAFAIAQQVLANMLDGDSVINRDLIKARLGEISISGLSVQDSLFVMNLATETVLNYYDVLINYLVRQKIQESRALPMVLQTIERGLALGLSSDTTPPPSP